MPRKEGEFRYLRPNFPIMSAAKRAQMVVNPSLLKAKHLILINGMYKLHAFSSSIDRHICVGVSRLEVRGPFSVPPILLTWLGP